MLKISVICWVLLSLYIRSIHGAESLYDRYVNRPRESNEVVYEKWFKFDSTVKRFVSSAIKYALPTILDSTSKLNVTSKCMKEGLHLMAGLKNMKLWAFRMIDSSSKTIDGLLSGTISGLGNYDECLNTVVKNRNKGNIMFRGKYCKAKFHPIPPLEEKTAIEAGLGNFSKLSEMTREFLRLAELTEMSSISIALCVPSGCTNDDIHQLVQYGADQLLLRAYVSECHVKEEYQFSTSAIIAIFLYSIPVCLVIIGTTIDTCSKQKAVQFKHKGFQVLTAFSIPKNYEKLMDTSASEQSLPCLHGFRFMSILWIMILHNYLFTLYSLPLHANALKYVEFMPELLMQIIFNGILAVDTFFFLSGLLNCYNRVKAEERNRSSNPLVLLRRRLWRIYPGYIFILISAFLLTLIGFGPMHDSVNGFFYKCEERWWRNLMFVNNLVNADLQKMCYGHTWYLACDMQLFLISLFAIYPLLKWPRFGVAFNVIICLFFVIFTGIWIWGYDYPPTLIPRQPLESYSFYVPYTKPFFHASPYFIGMLTGYLIAKRKEMKISKMAQLLGWSLTTIMALALILGSQKWNMGVVPTPMESALYTSLGKAGYSLALSWIVICCVYGYGGVVNSILGWKSWIPLGRLTFAVYLVSPVVQITFLASIKTTPEISQSTLIRRYIADVVLSCAIAGLLFIFVESPFAALENILLPRGKVMKPTAEKSTISKIDLINACSIGVIELNPEDRNSNIRT